MARNKGVTVRASIGKLSDAAVLQLAAFLSDGYSAYLTSVTANPPAAAALVAEAGNAFRQVLTEALAPNEAVGG